MDDLLLVFLLMQGMPDHSVLGFLTHFHRIFMEKLKPERSSKNLFFATNSYQNIIM